MTRTNDKRQRSWIFRRCPTIATFENRLYIASYMSQYHLSVGTYDLAIRLCYGIDKAQSTRKWLVYWDKEVNLLNMFETIENKIRTDHWSSKTSIDSLAKTLGHGLVPQIEWLVPHKWLEENSSGYPLFEVPIEAWRKNKFWMDWGVPSSQKHARINLLSADRRMRIRSGML